MKKIDDLQFLNPPNLMEYIRKSGAGDAIRANPELFKTKSMSRSIQGVHVQTVYGWFWVNPQATCFSWIFFATEELCEIDHQKFLDDSIFYVQQALTNRENESKLLVIEKPRAAG